MEKIYSEFVEINDENYKIYVETKRVYAEYLLGLVNLSGDIVPGIFVSIISDRSEVSKRVFAVFTEEKVRNGNEANNITGLFIYEYGNYPNEEIYIDRTIKTVEEANIALSTFSGRYNRK